MDSPQGQVHQSGQFRSGTPVAGWNKFLGVLNQSGWLELQLPLVQCAGLRVAGGVALLLLVHAECHQRSQAGLDGRYQDIQ